MNYRKATAPRNYKSSGKCLWIWELEINGTKRSWEKCQNLIFITKITYTVSGSLIWMILAIIIWRWTKTYHIFLRGQFCTHPIHNCTLQRTHWTGECSLIVKPVMILRSYWSSSRPRLPHRPLYSSPPVAALKHTQTRNRGIERQRDRGTERKRDL